MALLKLGQVVATPGALSFCSHNGINILELIGRHQNGDWGDLDEDDHKANENAIAYGGRIFSVYKFGEDGKLYVITEADFSSTCVLTPSEY